jgi:hypothetical protein
MSQKKQKQIQKSKQIQDLAFSYGITGNILSALECYANRFQTDQNKQTNIFSAYNNFDCGNKKTAEQLRNQIITQLEILKISITLYSLEHDKYEFPQNMSKESMVNQILEWKKWIPEVDRKYYKTAIDILEQKKSESYVSELGDNSKINPNFLMNSVGLIHESNQIGVEAIKNYEEKGIVPSLDLNSKKVGNEKINATSKPEEERRKQQKNLDNMLDAVTHGFIDLLQIQTDMDKGKQTNDVTKLVDKFENNLLNISEALYKYKEKYQFYCYLDQKEEQDKKIIELKELYSQLTNLNFDVNNLNTLINNLDPASMK